MHRSHSRLAKSLAALIHAGLLLCIPVAALAEDNTENNSLELGAGIGSITIADYRGSSRYQTYALPVPYIVYRGKYIKADRRGVRSDFWRTDQYELNISLGAPFTPDSDDNPLREGMPELKSTFEMGPALSINLSGDNLSSGWLLYLPARAIMAFDENSIGHVGWVLHPQFAYRGHAAQWYLTYNAGLYYGNRDYHDYYYGVDDQYATATRPAYQASAGYSGASTQISVRRRNNNWWYGGYLRYDNLSGSRFEDSPLVETEHYFTLGLAITWIFK